MKNLILGTLIALAVAGCATTKRDYSGIQCRPIPEEKAFWKIYNSNGDCTDKAKMYCIALAEKGLKSSIAVVDPGGAELHAIVYFKDGRWFDPAAARSGHDIDEAGRYLFEVKW